MDIRKAIEEARREFSFGEYYSRMRIQEKLMLIESLLPPEGETRDDGIGLYDAVLRAEIAGRALQYELKRAADITRSCLVTSGTVAAEPAPSSEKAPHGKDDTLRLEMWQFDQLCAFIEHARVNGRTIGDTEEAIKIQQMLKQIERQFPTPTQWAYDQACTALHKHAAAEKALCIAARGLIDEWQEAKKRRVYQAEDIAQWMRDVMDNKVRQLRMALCASSPAPSNKGAPDGPTD